MKKLVLDLDELDHARDAARKVLDAVMDDGMDLQKAGRALEAVGRIQHDAKLRLQAAVILNDGEHLKLAGGPGAIAKPAAVKQAAAA